MVRTKADSGSAATRKVVAARAPRKVLGNSASAGASASGDSPAGKGKYAGGNPACARPTPDWQKGIGMFLKKSPSKSTDGTEKENSDPTEIEEEEVVEGSSSSAGPSSSNAEIEADSDS
ncbi:PCNA-associated factor-like [Mizuhopecten yessoensis]|uniref:PCNA-associated factor n=1 Tax=Mizuhopecten yessoensis TaxID=6573 RepID=A0A210PX70_MIZYE|nr:PCNA-associated factor-like [Mizuhopecten yessoensis]OWF41056.1 PCNA-associated factor [Mizuhopecten yessoensis]